MDRHIHPDTESFSNAKSSGIWESSFLNSGNAEYSWSIQDNSESSEFSGSRRVVVSIDVEISGSGTSNYPDAVFYMKQDGSDWKIRAIYESVAREDADDPLLRSIVDPTDSPVRE